MSLKSIIIFILCFQACITADCQKSLLQKCVFLWDVYIETKSQIILSISNWPMPNGANTVKPLYEITLGQIKYPLISTW